MAHKVCIDGTAYEIDGGKAMVDGTVYEIDHGVANVDGTAYEVGFARDPVITITGEGSYSSYGTTQYAAAVTVDGTVYHSDAEITVPVGTTITLAVRGNDNQYFYYPAVIYLNGEQMFVGDSEGASPSNMIFYVDYVVQGNVSIQLEMNTYQQFGTAYYGTIYITET